MRIETSMIKTTALTRILTHRTFYRAYLINCFSFWNVLLHRTSKPDRDVCFLMENRARWRRMNGKTKIAVIAGLMLVAVVSLVYVAPVLAYMNGTSDQTRDRDRDRLRDQTCSCDCLQTQNQTCNQLRLQECTQNQTSAGSMNCQQQSQYQYRFRHQNMLLR